MGDEAEDNALTNACHSWFVILKMACARQPGGKREGESKNTVGCPKRAYLGLGIQVKMAGVRKPGVRKSKLQVGSGLWLRQ